MWFLMSEKKASSDCGFAQVLPKSANKQCGKITKWATWSNHCDNSSPRLNMLKKTFCFLFTVVAYLTHVYDAARNRAQLLTSHSSQANLNKTESSKSISITLWIIKWHDEWFTLRWRESQFGELFVLFRVIMFSVDEFSEWFQSK